MGVINPNVEEAKPILFPGECAEAVRGGRCHCGRQPGRRAVFQEGKCRKGWTPGASLVEAGEGEASRTAGKSIREERKTEIPPGKASDFVDEVGGEKQRGAPPLSRLSPGHLGGGGGEPAMEGQTHSLDVIPKRSLRPRLTLISPSTHRACRPRGR